MSTCSPMLNHPFLCTLTPINSSGHNYTVADRHNFLIAGRRVMSASDFCIKVKSLKHTPHVNM